jgi:hypothetical protein
VTAAAVIIVVVLFVTVIVLSRKWLAVRRLEARAQRRAETSRIASVGQWLRGDELVPIVVALSDAAFYYENDGFSGFLDLEWLNHVSYVDRLSTGELIGNQRVMRLLCFKQPFEFVLQPKSVAEWKAMLPAGEQLHDREKVSA